VSIETCWASFADEDRFRGLAIVDVDVDEDGHWAGALIQKTIAAGCNAGPDTSVSMGRCRCLIPSEHKNRLITDKDEAQRVLDELAQRHGQQTH
jgi:hypothetical protein